jgi:hypothetical protein
MKRARSIRLAFANFKLANLSDKIFDMSTREENKEALDEIRKAKETFGDLTNYRFGIELVLLEIFLKGCTSGIHKQDYDWDSLTIIIIRSEDYNEAEKLHVLIYLEELASTAGITLHLDDIVNVPAPRQKVSGRLLRRFPKLSAGTD